MKFVDKTKELMKSPGISRKELLSKCTANHLYHLKRIMTYGLLNNNSKAFGLLNDPITIDIKTPTPDNLAKERSIALGGKLNG